MNVANQPRYLVAGCTPWAKRVYEKTLAKITTPHTDEYTWRFIEHPDDFGGAVNAHWQPTYIFFLHWRWKVPAEIVTKYECIGFHLGRLPSEGGGSPLQWRILDGQDEATLSEFRMTAELDAGPVLNERLVPLDGSAEAVYARAMRVAASMIEWRINNPSAPPLPMEQHNAEPFRRRKPEDSRIPTFGGSDILGCVYDHIRCVDADGYPRAFLEYGGLRFEFDRAVLYDGKIKADVVITEAAR